MTFADSPNIEYTPDGRPPEKPDRGPSLVRVAIVLVLIIAIGANAYAWFQGNMGSRLTGTDGVVAGQVLLPDGEPLAHAEVFLASEPQVIERTDSSGNFSLENVPTGRQTLIVGYARRGVEVPVNIHSGQITEIEPVLFETPTTDS